MGAFSKQKLDLVVYRQVIVTSNLDGRSMQYNFSSCV